MAVKLSKVRTRTLPPIDVDGEELNITYIRPTPQYFDEGKAAFSGVKEGQEPGAVQTITAMVLPLIADWDLVDDAGEKLDITAENLLMLPAATLLEIQRLISERENTAKNEPTPSASTI